MTLSEDRIPLLFVILQTGAGANGGVASISAILDSLSGFRPIILTNRESDRTSAWRHRGYEVHMAPESVTSGIRRDPAGYARTYLTYFGKIRRILRRSGSRLIHANDPAAFQLALPAARFGGAKILLNLRDTLDPGRVAPRWKYGRMFRAADHLLYLSQEMAQSWAEIAPGAKRAHSVTYSIVDLERFSPSTLPEGRPTILLTGMVCPKKNQLEFLRHSAPTLVEAGVRIRIAGDFDPESSAYSAACRDAAGRLGQGVEMLGYREDLPQLIRESHLVVVASRHEGLVRSMIEAMSCARPIVSTPVCSAREMLERPGEEAGQVVPFGDHDGMTTSVLRFLSDRNLAARTGKTGRALAERFFTREAVVGRYEAVYRKMSEQA